jgi:predicted transposase YbfD/YdcC
MQVSFPHIQTVVKIWRESTAYKTNEKEICYYLSSEPFDRRTPEQWLDLVRGHWGGIEIRNHWKKDAILLEDKTRSRNPTLVGTLAMLRNILLFMHKEQDEHTTLPGFVEATAADKNKAFSMLMRCF